MIEGGNRLNNKKLNKKPLVTLITVVKNGGKHLEDCIQSIINQSFKNFEYIIIDGDSNDNTHSIIKKYEKSIDYYSIEKDKGIYDGFNKGSKKLKVNILAL